MAWGSDLADDKVGPTWEVGPTEDVVQALMETLVDPLLPLSVSNVPPPEDDQISVAKQMHAVVLLYNYHHRRQKPELIFLDFPSFCKLSVVVKPPLVSFMKLTMESGSTQSSAAENQLSITEKAIKDACDIALALDAKSESPNIEGWPISKVAILLIDSEKENCMLRFGDVTKGVWSLIEKELDASKIEQDMSPYEKKGDKRKRNGLPTYDDDEFLRLGYDAVNHITGTGIGSCNPQVLSTHTTYSLSKAKSAVRFYMVQCSGSFDVKEEVSLKFLVDSLQGPLAEKLDYGFWKTTTVVEFYHMLPYVEFISCWLSGSGTEVHSSDKIATENCDRNKSEHSSRGNVKSPVRISQSTSNLDEKCDNLYSSGNKKSRIGLEVSDTDNVVEKKFDKKHDVAHLDKQSDDRRDEDLLSGPLSGLKEMNTNEMTKTCTESADSSKKVISKLRVYHHRKKNNSSTQNNASVGEDGGRLKVHTVGSLNLHHPECRDEKVINEDKGDVTISNDQRAIAGKENLQIQFEAKTKCSLQVQNISASEELQNALSLLYRKRQELYSQVCNMEDTLAFYENDIIRIRDGGDVGVARECIKALLSGSYHSMLEHGTQNQDNSESHREKKTRLSEIYLPGKSSRQDLEYICLTNNWRLPRYLIEPSDGKFMSNVFVQGKDNIELQSKGSVEYNPCEARESAAAQMIAKLRNF